MKAYNIRFPFRGRNIEAFVNEYDTFCLVYPKDEEIMKEFGGQLHFTLPEKTLTVQRKADEKKSPYYKGR